MRCVALDCLEDIRLEQARPSCICITRASALVALTKCRYLLLVFHGCPVGGGDHGTDGRSLEGY